MVSTNPHQPLSNSSEYLQLVELIKLNDFNGLEAYLKQYNGDISYNGIIFSMLDKTPLMIASIYGHIECMDVLLRHGASVNTMHSSGLSCLFYSIKYRQYAAARHLIQHYQPIISSTIRETSTNRDMLLTVALDIRNEVIGDRSLDGGSTRMDTTSLATDASNASLLSSRDDSRELASGLKRLDLEPIMLNLEHKLFSDDDLRPTHRQKSPPGGNRPGGIATTGYDVDTDDDIFTPLAPSESFLAGEDLEMMGCPPTESPPLPPLPWEGPSAASDKQHQHGQSGSTDPHPVTLEDLLSFFDLLLKHGSFSVDLCDINGDNVEAILRQLKIQPLLDSLKTYKQRQYEMFESSQRWVFSDLLPACKTADLPKVVDLLSRYITDRTLPPELMENYVVPSYSTSTGADQNLPIRPLHGYHHPKSYRYREYYQYYALSLPSSSESAGGVAVPPLFQPSSLAPPPPPPSLSISTSLPSSSPLLRSSTPPESPLFPPSFHPATPASSGSSLPPPPPATLDEETASQVSIPPPPPMASFSSYTSSSYPSIANGTDPIVHGSDMSAIYLFTDYTVPYLHADARDASNNTALSYAILAGDIQLIDILIFYGASLTSVGLQHGSILTTAIHSQNPFVLVHLLSRYFTPFEPHLAPVVNYRDHTDKSVLELFHDRMLSHPTYLLVFTLLLNLTPNMVAYRTDRTYISYLIDADAKDNAILTKRMNERENARQHGHVDDAFVSPAEKALHARMSHRVTLTECILLHYPHLALLHCFDCVGMCSFDVLQTNPPSTTTATTGTTATGMTNSLTMRQLIIDAYVRGNLLGIVNSYGETLLQKAEIFDDTFKRQTLMLYYQRTPRQYIRGAMTSHTNALLYGSSLFTNPPSGVAGGVPPTLHPIPTTATVTTTTTTGGSTGGGHSQTKQLHNPRGALGPSSRLSIVHHHGGTSSGTMLGASNPAGPGARSLGGAAGRHQGGSSRMTAPFLAKSRFYQKDDEVVTTPTDSHDDRASQQGDGSSSSSSITQPHVQPFRELMLLRLIDVSAKIQSDIIARTSNCMTTSGGIQLSMQSITHCILNTDFAGLRAYQLHSPLHFDFRSRDQHGKTIFQVISDLSNATDVTKLDSFDLITSLLTHRADSSIVTNPAYDHPQFHTVDYLQRVFAELRPLIVQKPSPFYAPERREQVAILASHKKDKKLLKIEKEREKQREKIEKQREKFEKDFDLSTERELQRQRERDEKKQHKKESSGFSLFGRKQHTPAIDVIDHESSVSYTSNPGHRGTGSKGQQPPERRRQSLADVEFLTNDAYRASITLTLPGHTPSEPYATDHSRSSLAGVPQFAGEPVGLSSADSSASHSPSSRYRHHGLSTHESSMDNVSNASASSLTPRSSHVTGHGHLAGAGAGGSASGLDHHVPNTPFSRFDYVDPITGYTPLIQAILSCNIYLVEALLLMGVNPNFKLDPLFNPQVEQFPLFYAISCVNVTLEGGANGTSIHPGSSDNQCLPPTPSSAASLSSLSSASSSTSSLKFISNHHANYPHTNPMNNTSSNSLMNHSNGSQSSKLLRPPSLPSPHHGSFSGQRGDTASTSGGVSPMDALINVKMTKLLLYYGANPYVRNDLRGTLYHYMFWTSVARLETVVFVHTIIPQFINTYYDDESKKIGATPLHWLVNRKNVDEYLDVLEYLLEQHADPNLPVNLDNPKAADRNGSNALHLAGSKPGNLNAIQLLLQYGADPKHKNNKGKLPKDLVVDKAYHTPLQGIVLQKKV